MDPQEQDNPPPGCINLTENETHVPSPRNSPDSVTEVATIANLRNGNGVTGTTPALVTSSETDDNDSDSDSEGWIALEDLPRYTSSNGVTQFLDTEIENGEISIRDDSGKRILQPPPPLPIETTETTWRAEIDDLKPSIIDSAVPFELTPDQLDAVKLRMQTISLEYKPDWAEVVEERTWQEQLQTRLAGRQKEDKD